MLKALYFEGGIRRSTVPTSTFASLSKMGLPKNDELGMLLCAVLIPCGPAFGTVESNDIFPLVNIQKPMENHHF